MQAVVLVVDACRGRDVVHLVAQRPGLDVHRLVDARHPVDDERVRAGHVDHDRSVDPGSVGERDAGDPTVGPADVGHLGVEPELAAHCLGGALQVVGGELRVADVAGVGGEQGTDELAFGFGPEAVVLGAAGFAVGAVLEEGDAFGQCLVVPDLVGDVDLVEQRQDLLVVAAIEHEQHGAALHVEGVAAFVLGVEVAGPVLPVREALVGHRHAVVGGVVGAHDRTRVAGGAVARGRQLVEVERRVALLGQLEGDGGTDDPGADDDCVVPVVWSVGHG